MPSIRLYRDEVGEGRLPPVCLRCGAPATCSKRKTFSWHPQWIDILIILGLLVFAPFFPVGVICALVMTLRMPVWVPLCDAHRNYWRWRAVYIVGGAILFFLLGFGCLVFVFARPSGQISDLIGLLCTLPAGIGLIWLFSAAIIQNGMIRPTQITSESVTLGRVCREFIAALERDDSRTGGEYWDERRHSVQGSQHLYDAKVGRPRWPPSEGYQARPREE